MAGPWVGSYKRLPGKGDSGALATPGSEKWEETQKKEEEEEGIWSASERCSLLLKMQWQNSKSILNQRYKKAKIPTQTEKNPKPKTNTQKNQNKKQINKQTN